LEEIDKNENSSPNFLKQIVCSRRTKYMSFAAIPLAILLFYGIEDKNAWFFGHDYINDYRYRIENNVVYHVGIMVSHYALIVTLSIVGILISWIIYEAWKLSNISIKISHFEPISHLLTRTFVFCYKSFQSNPIKTKNISTVSSE